MAETIKGINVVIGAETTGLSAALSDVNKKSRDIQSELKQVEQLLKLDPTNTELIAQKQKLLSDAVANTTEKLDRLKTAQQQVADQFARGEISEGQYRAFQRELAKTEQELNKLEQGLRDIGPAADSAQENLDRMGKGLKETGDKMKGIGTSLTVGLTAPIVGIGVVAGKAALDVDKAAGKMEAALGVTAEQAEELAAASRAIWEKGFGESLDEVNRALITTRSNIQDLDDESLSQITQSALILQETFDADVNETTRTASVLMKNFGLDGQEAMDLMVAGFQKGGNFSDELLDTLREYAPQFKAMGISAEDALGILIKGAENGAFNLDKVGDAIKEFNIRVKDGSDSTYEAMAQLFAPDNIEEFAQALMTGSKQSAEYLELLKHVSKDTADTLVGYLQKGGKDAADAMTALSSILGGSNEIFQGLSSGALSGKDALVSVIQKLRELEDPLLQNTLGVALFGTQWEDLEKDVVLALDAGIGSLNDFSGATDRAGAALKDNLGDRLSSLWRTMQSSLIPLGEALVGLAETILPPIMSVVGQMSAIFASMGPEIQTVIVAFAGIVAALGPVLVIVGQVISAVSTIIPLFTSVSGALTAAGGASAAAGTALAALTGPIGLIIAAIAALGTAAYLTIKYWDEIKTFFTDLWGWIDDFFNGWGAEVTAALFPFLGIPLVIVKHWDEIKVGLSALWDWVKDFFAKWGAVLIPLLGPFLAIPLLIVKHWEDIKTGLTVLWTWIKNTAIELFNSTKDGFVQIWDGIKTYFSGVWELIKNIFGGSILLIVDLVTGDFEKLKSDSEAIWNNLKDAFGQIWDGIKKVFAGALSVIEGQVSTTWNAIKTVSTTIWDAIVSSIEKSIDWLKNLPASMLEIGKDIMRGLIDGIKSMIGAVGSTASSVADAITGGIRKALDIHSPSRVMRGLGEYTGEGFALGLSDSISNVQQRASDMAAATTSALSGVTASAASAASSTGNTALAGNTINMAGLFDGASINVRSDEDLYKITQLIFDQAQGLQRGIGGSA
ncbi:phage tail tape measure protein [Paenibacillus sp. y28]|uniref:phage tail tape measure protein n=1 Tax=Paenibacillus sp. y28 TaxID=3129110 RepID=UPI00301A0386